MRFPLVCGLLLSLSASCDGATKVTLTDASVPTIDAAVDPPYRCDLADCRDGFARTCNDDPQILDCSAFGASCDEFTDTESGNAFNWCSCGSLDEGDGSCLTGRYGVACYDGLGGLADCGLGYVCVPRPNGPFGIGCECNNFTDDICPGNCSADADCASCTPSCVGRNCGDNGCGGECGTCDFGDACSAQGRCEPICVPDCVGKQCGDDGCGGSCGTCAGTCSSAGTCQGACVPSCSGRTCGDDGCDGSCGSCGDGFTCIYNGSCSCDPFNIITYTFTLPPQSAFPPTFALVGVSVKHISDLLVTYNGEAMGFGPTHVQSFTFQGIGCRPKIEIKRDYVLGPLGAPRRCQFTDIIEGRTTFEIPVPVVNATPVCTAPPV